MARIIRKETIEHIDSIGDVRFEPLERAGQYWHDTYGRTHEQRFAFEHGGREYWGTIMRTFDRKERRTTVDVELRTRLNDGYSRAITETHKTDWREALVAAFKRHFDDFPRAEDIAARMRGKQTIDLTPTWAAIMPALIAALTDGTETGKALAREELMRLAKLVDAANAKGE